MTESGEKRWQVNERPERPDSLWLPSRRGMSSGASGVAMAATLAACGGGSAPAPSAWSPTRRRPASRSAAATSASASPAVARRTSSTASRSRPSPTRPASPPGGRRCSAYDRNYKLGTDGLAAEATQDNAKQWTIRLKGGIEFHNGKTLTADDVIYSLRRIGNPKNKLFGSAAMATMDIAGLKKMDKLTVRMPLQDGRTRRSASSSASTQRHRARRATRAPTS